MNFAVILSSFSLLVTVHCFCCRDKHRRWNVGGRWSQWRWCPKRYCCTILVDFI